MQVLKYYCTNLLDVVLSKHEQNRKFVCENDNDFVDMDCGFSSRIGKSFLGHKYVSAMRVSPICVDYCSFDYPHYVPGEILHGLWANQG